MSDQGDRKYAPEPQCMNTMMNGRELAARVHGHYAIAAFEGTLRQAAAQLELLHAEIAPREITRRAGHEPSFGSFQ